MARPPPPARTALLGLLRGKGSGRVISVGPDSHPGVTLPWPVSASGWGTLGCTHSNPRSSRASHPQTTPSPLEQAAGASRRHGSRHQPARHSGGGAHCLELAPEPGGPFVKAQVQVGSWAWPGGPGFRVGLASANERAGGRSPLREPAALVWERDRFTHQDPIRGGQITTGWTCKARGQIRVGPDHGPELAAPA